VTPSFDNGLQDASQKAVFAKNTLDKEVHGIYGRRTTALLRPDMSGGLSRQLTKTSESIASLGNLRVQLAEIPKVDGHVTEALPS
jgi:type VI protein secretion system component VasK